MPHGAHVIGLCLMPCVVHNNKAPYSNACQKCHTRAPGKPRSSSLSLKFAIWGLKFEPRNSASPHLILYAYFDSALYVLHKENMLLTTVVLGDVLALLRWPKTQRIASI
jgi:hypothetical protein